MWTMQAAPKQNMHIGRGAYRTVQHVFIPNLKIPIVIWVKFSLLDTLHTPYWKHQGRQEWTPAVAAYVRIYIFLS